MEGVQFEEDTFRGYQQSAIYQEEPESKVIKLLIKSGIAKNKKQANIVLLSCAVLFFALTAYLFAASSDPEPEIKPYSELSQDEKQKVPVQERVFLESMQANQ